jgi:hypothetical protein
MSDTRYTFGTSKREASAMLSTSGGMTKPVRRLGVSDYTSYTPDSYVYFVQQIETGFVKIGLAKNYRERISGLQVAQPQTLIIRLLFGCIGEGYSLRVERAFHEYFKQEQITPSHEWFALSECQITDLIKLIEVAHKARLPGDMLTLQEFMPQKEIPDLSLSDGGVRAAYRVVQITPFFLREREELIMENLELSKQLSELEFNRKGVSLIISLLVVIIILNELSYFVFIVSRFMQK